MRAIEFTAISMLERVLVRQCEARNSACYKWSMSDQYRLAGLGNSELLAGLSALVRQSNVLSAHTTDARMHEVPTIGLSSPPLAVGATVPAERRRAPEIEPLSPARFGVHFTADAELRDLIERARALASHRLPNGDLASLMKLMAASFVRQEEKRRFGIGAGLQRRKIEATAAQRDPGAPPGEVALTLRAAQSTDGASGSPRATELTDAVVEHAAARSNVSAVRSRPGSKRGRYLRMQVRREVHERDRCRCAFVSSDGRRCTASAFLQFDHITPFARHGAADTRNIRLLCRAHNALHARRCFGAVHLAAKIAATRRAQPKVPEALEARPVER